MDVTFTSEQALMRESVAKLLAAHPPARRLVGDVSLPSLDGRLWADLAGAGWLGLVVPEADGGLGGSGVDVNVVLTEAGRAGAIVPMTTSAIVASSLIAACGSAEQKSAWLSAMMVGEKRVAVALEPSSISVGGPASARQLTGRLSLVADAGWADAVLVAARAENGGAELFIVDTQTKGLGRTPVATLDDSCAADLQFEGTPVGSGSQLANGAVEDEIERARSLWIAASCAEAAGTMAFLVEATLAYTKGRVQFGKPLTALQSVQHALARMKVAAEEARAIALFAALNLDAEPSLCARALSSAKGKIGDASRFVAQTAVQLHGGMGVSEEMPVASRFRRLLAFEARLGSTHAHFRQLGDLIREKGGLDRPVAGRDTITAVA